MPSRYYSPPTTPPLPHLSDIIKLEPDGEPWCAGFARSQGRRCHNRTNARGRKAAVSLLDEGTRELHAGYYIDDLLEDLAPYVLCTRWHQGQAPELVRTWQRRVDRFLDSYNTSAPAAPSRPPRTTTSLSTSARRTDGGRRELGVERDSSSPTENLERRLHEMTLEIEQLRASVSATQSTVQNLNSNGRARAPSGSVRPVGGVDVGVARDGSARSMDTSRARSSSSTASSPVTLTPVSISPTSTNSTSTLDDVPRHARATARITLPSSRPNEATRRPIEGECSICLNPLRRIRFRADSSPGDEVVGVDTEDTESDAEDTESDAEDTDSDAEDTDSDAEDTGFDSEEESEDDEEQQGLVWCRSQCGVNYHTECIEQWLQESRHRNCPTCRSEWSE